MTPSERGDRPQGLELIAAALICVALCVSYYPIDPPELKISYISYLLLGIGSICVVKSDYFLRNRHTLALIGIAAAFLLITYAHQTYNPPLTKYADSKLRNLIFSIAFYLLIVPLIFSSATRARLLMHSLLAFSLFYCAMNLFYDPSAQDLRYSESGLNPTLMGTIVLIPAIFAICHRKDAFISRVILYAMIALSLWFSIRTGSRGPVLALVLSYGIFLVAKHGMRGVMRYAIYAPLIILLGALFISLLPQDISYRFSLAELSLESQSDEGDRAILWQIALTGLSHTWTGYGLGNYSVMTFIAAPHNILLETMFELGVYISLIYAVIIFLPAIYLKSLVSEGLSSVDFFVFLYILNLILGLVNGETTLPSAILYISVGFVWGYVGWKKLSGASARNSSRRAAFLR